MPMTKTGKKVMKNMMETYKDPKKAKQVFYASKNAGKPGAEKWEGPKRGKDKSHHSPARPL